MGNERWVREGEAARRGGVGAEGEGESRWVRKADSASRPKGRVFVRDVEWWTDKGGRGWMVSEGGVDVGWTAAEKAGQHEKERPNSRWKQSGRQRLRFFLTFAIANQGFRAGRTEARWRRESWKGGEGQGERGGLSLRSIISVRPSLQIQPVPLGSNPTPVHSCHPAIPLHRAQQRERKRECERTSLELRDDVLPPPAASSGRLRLPPRLSLLLSLRIPTHPSPRRLSDRGARAVVVYGCCHRRE